MTDHVDSLDDPSDDELAALAALLDRAAPWDDLPSGLEDAVVGAITGELVGRPADAPSAPVAATPLAPRRARRSWSAASLVGAAAAVVLTVAGVAILVRGDTDGVTFALEGTEAEPGATADATVSATPAGLRIILDTDGLPAAPEGYMYEAWVGDGELAVSAGTFHLRGGDESIELWAGVSDPHVRYLWITLEPLDDDAASSTDARLRGEFSLDD
jgi:hypothetical protein